MDTTTCALDVVSKRGALSLAEVGELFFLTRERIRQIEGKALRKLRRWGGPRGLADLLGPGEPDDPEGDDPTWPPTPAPVEVRP